MSIRWPVRLVDTVLDRSFVLGYTSIGLRTRKALPDWPADPAPDALQGRHAIVTGASSGLGIATVEGLSDLGATVHLVVRDLDKGTAIRDQILATRPTARLRLWRCDVGDLDDVARFAGEIAAEVPRIAALIHNAGVMPAERTESAQGHELSMAVHLLGPVLMTTHLLPRLEDGRVVFVSSGGLYGQRLQAADPEFRVGRYSPTKAYARSKRMQVELLPLLADLWTIDGVMVAAMHPGWADTPGVRASLPRFRSITARILRDDAQGADTSVWLAAIEPTPPSGRFWHDRRPRPIDMFPKTRATAEERSEAWRWLQETLGWQSAD